MKFPLKYDCLRTNVYENLEFKIVPIRFQDRLDIMNWRNEQMYHLRQSEPLNEEKQDKYFNTNISSLFHQEKPSQLLFSFLKNNKLIGYGGLVHINWIDKNAEISFIMDTKLEKEHFEFYWIQYLNLIEKVAFNELRFHKVFTFAFDLRQHLYSVFSLAGFKKEARLKDHCCFQDKFIDVVIHSKINNYE